MPEGPATGLTGADVIARRLAEAGCKHAFGIPGGEVLAMMAALERWGLAFHLCKHENSGGFMAEGTHHATGAPGVLLATVGPGVANAINVIANAEQDKVPLIFLTGAIDPADTHTFTHQVFDQQALLRPIVKASFQVTPGAEDVIIDKAIAIAMEGRPGPVHVDIPIKVATGTVADTPSVRRAPLAPAAPAASTELDAARDAFAKAERPLMVAGVDVLHQGAEQAVADFCRTHQVPLITSYKAKGVLPEDEPLALGGAGLSPLADDVLMPFIKQSDCILLAGYDPIEMRVGWRDPWDADQTVIEFSAVANTHYVHQATHNFIGDVAAGLAAISEGVAPRNASWPGGEAAATRAKLKDTFSSHGKWGPAAVCEAARNALPPETVITADTGAHRILLSQMWDTPMPRGVLQSNALCTMGTALPLAIGHKLAAPDAPCVVFTGDAGLEMIMGELATLRDLKLTIPVVVFIDQQLALIEKKQRASGYELLGVEFGATDFAAVGEAMGGVGVTAASVEQVEQALTDALARDTFTVIACPIGRNAYDGTF